MAIDTKMILKSLNANLQTNKLYPQGHPSVAISAKNTFKHLDEYFKENDKLVVGIVGEALVFADLPVDNQTSRTTQTSRSI
jgi:hypothetical protein